MQNKNIFQTFCATILLAVAGVASAGSVGGTLAVSAKVDAVCTIGTTPVAFGVYDPVTTNATVALNGAGGVTIACTKGAGPSVTLGLGANASGATRQMKGSGTNTDVLAYELYQPSTNAVGAGCTYAGATVWGTSGSNVFTPTSPSSKASRTYTVCGQVGPGQDVQVDTSYTDTVVATVNF